MYLHLYLYVYIYGCNICIYTSYSITNAQARTHTQTYQYIQTSCTYNAETSVIEILRLYGSLSIHFSTFLQNTTPPQQDSDLVQSKFDHGTHDVHYSQATNPDFWDPRPLPVYEAFAQHHPRAVDTCNNTCDQREPYCNVTNFYVWLEINNRGLMPYKPFLARGQYVFHWEKNYLSYPPLVDLKTLPDLNLSTVTLEGSHNGAVKCKAFDILIGRVDLVDRYGRRRGRGDDEVRVWIVSRSQPLLSAVGEVKDMKNGSYLFQIRCLWPGYTIVGYCDFHSVTVYYVGLAVNCIVE